MINLWFYGETGVGVLLRWHQFFVSVRSCSMKATLFVIAIGLVAPCLSMAQSPAPSPNIIRIKGGVGGEKAVPVSSRYRYDQFRMGRILYVNGSTGTTRLNYNILLGEMQFIDARGDTLALTDEPVVRLVGIDEIAPTGGVLRQDMFCYDQKKGYLELVGDYGGVKLAAKQGLRMAKSEKEGGYGQSTGSGSITTYQFYSTGTASVNRLDAQGDLLLIKDKNYYIVDQNNRVHPINKATILKVFSKHREQVTAYLERESVDFRKQSDLEKLLKYCSELL